jgi:hypothetical protein
VRKDLVLMCEEVFIEKVCAGIKHGRKLCVASTCSKASGFLFQLVVPLKSTVGFVSNLNQFFFKRCKSFSPNLSIIRFVVRELHLLEVEGVCSGIHGRISITRSLEFCFK